MYTISEGETKETPTGREHKGTYGSSHGKEDVRDQYGHKVGKINKGAADKKNDAPKKRGRPTKAAKDSTGADIKHDTSGIQAMLGKKPNNEVGKKSVKHSLKDWIEASEQKSLNEDGQYVTKPIPQQNTQLQQVIGPDGRPALNQPIPTSAALRVASALSSGDSSQGMTEEGKGLWANIHAKRERIKNGSSERMRKPGSKGAPTASALKKSATEGEEISLSNPGKFSNQEHKDNLNQRYGQPDLNTSRMNKQHQDFYDKNPSFKQSGKETVSLGDRRLASKVEPAVTDTKVGRIPMSTPGGSTGRGGGTGLGGRRPGDDNRLNPLKLEAAEKKTMSRAAKGHEKYGKEGMQALAKAGRDGASEKKLDTIRNKYDKYDNEVSEAKDLPGDQDNLDVAPPKGKLTSADFKALRTKKKVKESLSFNEMMGETNDEMQDMLAELQQDIEHFNTTGHCSDKLQAFLNIHGHAKKKMTDEGQHTQHYLDANKPSIVRQHAEIAQAPKQHTPWKADPISAASNMATDVAQSMGKKTSGFLKSLSPFSMTESKNMIDIQLENWEKELNSLLNEGITVSSSTGQQGSPDSVSINATDADAQELLSIVRQAGLGVFGGDKPQSNYGAPMHDNPSGHGTEPEMSPTVVGDDSDMLALIKKMTGISIGGEEGSMDGGHGSDYEDEEGSEDTALQPADSDEEHDSGEESEEGDEEEVDENLVPVPNPSGASSADDAKRLGGMMPKPAGSNRDPISELTAEYPGGSTPLPEDEVEEGNEFSGNRADAIKNHQDNFEVDGKKYPVKEDEIEEGHDHETCNECGSAMYEGHTCGDEQVEEGYANETGHEELAQLKALLGMGNDMHRPKNSQATGNVQKVTMETKLMKQSSDLLVDFRKLSGIK